MPNISKTLEKIFSLKIGEGFLKIFRNLMCLIPIQGIEESFLFVQALFHVGVALKFLKLRDFFKFPGIKCA